MLHALRGRTHAVFTAAVVLDETGERSRIARSLVTFKQLTDAEIDAYIASGDPLDKAGGYGIQALDHWVAGISGAKDTVMGLPLHAVQQLLQTGPQPPVR
jgi:septum formation protein